MQGSKFQIDRLPLFLRPGPALLLLALCVVAGALPPIASAAPVILRTENSTVHVGRRMEILADPGGRLLPEKIFALGRRGAFRPVLESTPNFGFTETVYWVRFRIANRTELHDWLLQFAYAPMDDIRLYAPARGGMHRVKRAGDTLPFGAREKAHRTFLFGIQPGNVVRDYYYMRFESRGTLEFPLFVYSPETLRIADRREQFVLGIYYGILAVLSLYNLILFFVVRDISYFYYLVYLVNYGVFQMNLNGLAYEFLWPNWPWWANHSLPFVIGFSFFSALLFTRNFLNTRENAPGMHQVIHVLMGLFLVLMVCAITADYSTSIAMAAILGFCFPVVVLITSMSVWKKGYRPARYFVIAWLSLLVGVALYALKGYGVLPANFVTEYGLQIGSAVEMSLLSISLAERMNIMSMEKEEARRHAVEIQQLHQEAQLHSARLEIELLKKNIQPHFLLNSINATIVWLQEDPASAARLMNALADELRMLLSMSNRTVVTVEEELQLCRAHLEVMSLRHDKQFVLEVEDLPGDEMIPPLIIHTLIENGITHGFRARENGVFRLTRELTASNGRRKPGRRYVLTNDGSPEKKSDKASSGMGLKYVRTRLQEAYPGKWRIRSSAFAGGWKTIIDMPASRG